jgi:hypothetical protein
VKLHGLPQLPPPPPPIPVRPPPQTALPAATIPIQQDAVGGAQPALAKRDRSAALSKAIAARAALTQASNTATSQGAPGTDSAVAAAYARGSFVDIQA